MLDKLTHLDRRWLFLIVALTVVLAILFPVKLAIIPTPATRSIYNFMQGLKPGSTILLSFDYGPSTAPECDPMAVTMLQQCFSRGIRVIAMALFAPESVPFMRTDMRKLGDEYHKQYGVDYVMLGYQTGGVMVIKSLGSGFASAFPTDVDGKPLSSYPLIQQVKGYADLAGVMSMSAGDPGIKYWVQVISAEYKRPVGGGVTAVYFPEMQPFLESHQMLGMLGGLRGAAEYEALVGIPGQATQGMFAQSVLHVLIALFIVISNILYFAGRNRRRRV
ncbi:MAG: hypothetical protein ACYCW6_32490 [Candidatus Xenobia bacterium]